MSTKTRSLKLILIITFFGCILGSLLNRLFIYIIPENTIIRKFFIDTTYLMKIPENFKINLDILKVGFTFELQIGIFSMLGIFISWYFLKYFR